MSASNDYQLCKNCGRQYYSADIPAELADVGQYGTCEDCKLDYMHESADWLAWARGIEAVTA